MRPIHWQGLLLLAVVCAIAFLRLNLKIADLQDKLKKVSPPEPKKDLNELMAEYKAKNPDF